MKIFKYFDVVRGREGSFIVLGLTWLKFSAAPLVLISESLSISSPTSSLYGYKGQGTRPNEALSLASWVAPTKFIEPVGLSNDFAVSVGDNTPVT